MSQPLAIDVNELTFQYKNSNTAFFIPQWSVQAGERIFVQGPSGSGKSTLLNLLAGVIVPTKGSINMLGEDFSGLSSNRRDHFRARHIGVVFQQFNLIPFLSVLQNVQAAAYFASSGSKDVKPQLAGLMDKLALPSGLMDRSARELSVGQQQRVAIARALINHPEILLVDEPTSALDADARDAFMQVLIELCEQNNTTLIFVSHDNYLKHCFDNVMSVSQIITQGEAEV